jgi:predicted small secreted protein
MFNHPFLRGVIAMKKTPIFLMSLILLLALALAACGETAEEASTDVDIVADTVDTTETTIDEETPAAFVAETEVESEAVVETTVSLTEDYAEDALPIRTQLMIGTLKLEDSSLAISPEQASELLVLWQASAALSRSGTGAEIEVLAVINQLEEAMTPEQIVAIANMQLTRESIQAMSQEMGLSTGSGDGEGAANRGQGQNMTDAEKAAREAEQADRTSNGTSNALLDLLIEILVSRSQ